MGSYRIGEDSFAPQRRKENQVASDLLDDQGLTPEAAAAILKTRSLSPNIFGLVMNALKGARLTPEIDTSKYKDVADS